MKDKNLKILAVCHYGLIRSAVTRRCLNGRGYENVVNVGINCTSQETLAMLCEWADKILIAEPSMLYQLPEFGFSKVDSIFTIGPDIWQSLVGNDLHKVIQKQLDVIGL